MEKENTAKKDNAELIRAADFEKRYGNDFRELAKLKKEKEEREEYVKIFWEYIVCVIIVFPILLILNFFFPNGTENPYYHANFWELIVVSFFVGAFVWFLKQCFKNN